MFFLELFLRGKYVGMKNFKKTDKPKNGLFILFFEI